MTPAPRRQKVHRENKTHTRSPLPCWHRPAALFGGERLGQVRYGGTRCQDVPAEPIKEPDRQKDRRVRCAYRTGSAPGRRHGWACRGQRRLSKASHRQALMPLLGLRQRSDRPRGPRDIQVSEDAVFLTRTNRQTGGFGCVCPARAQHLFDGAKGVPQASGRSCNDKIGETATGDQG